MKVDTVDPKFEYLLRLGDNALVLSQQLGAWCGHGPALEEDLALTNVALDLLGQARLWLSYAGEVEGKGRDEDALAYLRDGAAFRNLLLVEQPNGDFAQTLVRQLFFDLWHHLVLEQLKASKDRRVAEIAEKAAKEVDYHLERSRDLAIRLGDGSEESRRRMQAGVDELWVFTAEMLTPDDLDRRLAAAGIGADLGQLAPEWERRIEEILEEATLTRPEGAWMLQGGKLGRHSEHMGYILAEMQFLQRAYPGAAW